MWPLMVRAKLMWDLKNHKPHPRYDYPVYINKFIDVLHFVLYVWADLLMEMT